MKALEMLVSGLGDLREVIVEAVKRFWDRLFGLDDSEIRKIMREGKKPPKLFQQRKTLIIWEYPKKNELYKPPDI